MNWSQILVPVLLILIQLITVWALVSVGTIEPKIVEVGIGENIYVTCSMNLNTFKGYNSSSLFFVKNNNESFFLRDQVKILNETSISFIIPNATEQKQSYYCGCNQTDGVRYIDILEVSVGSAPKPIEKLKCRSYNYEYMICNFAKPINAINTKYHLSYTIQDPNYHYDCVLEEAYDHVKCTLGSKVYRKNEGTFNFTLEANNALGSLRQYFLINNKKSVILDKPVLSVKNVTTRSLTATFPFIADVYPPLKYEVRLCAENFDCTTLNESNYTIATKIPKYDNEKILHLMHLPYSYYNYELTLRMRVISSEEDEDLWSEMGSLRFQTKPRRPDNPPKTDNGSFYLLDNNKPRVVIFWQDFGRLYENGPDFRYEIKACGNSAKICGNPEIIAADRTSVELIWNQAQSCEYCISSCNSIGCAKKSSRVVVPSSTKSQETYSPWGISNTYEERKSRTEGDYIFSWEPPHHKDGLVDYTLFWCLAKANYLNKCNGTIYFEHLPKNKTEHRIDTRSRGSPLNIAISANFESYNTGMHWVTCTSRFDQSFGEMKIVVKPTSARSLLVTWTIDDVCLSIINGYNLRYCEKSECSEENTRTIPISRTAKEYELKDLKTFTEYQISIQMFSKWDKANWTASQDARTEEEAPSAPRDLKDLSVKSNSILLSWLPPLHPNGIIRNYTVSFKSDPNGPWDERIINCLDSEPINTCGNSTHPEVVYNLERLSSFSSYTILVTAHNAARQPSDSSNLKIVKTLVGIPSKPRKFEYDSSNILSWQAPEVPSGRVELYEVKIVEYFRNVEKRQAISYVVKNATCLFRMPSCPGEFKWNLHVRAINAVSRITENYDSELPSSDNDTNYNEKESPVDLQCQQDIDYEEQKTAISDYVTSGHYVLYKSVWADGPIIACGIPRRTNMSAFINSSFVIAGLLLLAAMFFMQRKIKKMKDIGIKLPGNLADTTDKGKLRDSSWSPHESSDKSSARLLLSDSGVDCSHDKNCDLPPYPHYRPDPITHLDKPRVFSEDGYIVTDNPLPMLPSETADYCSVNEIPKPSIETNARPSPPGLPVTTDNYLILNNKLPVAPPPTLPANHQLPNNYVQLNALQRHQQQQQQQQLPANSYVKPSNLFLASKLRNAEDSGHYNDTTENTIFCNTNNGYVMPSQQNLFKPIVFSGYTTPETLKQIDALKSDKIKEKQKAFIQNEPANGYESLSQMKY